MSGCPRPQSYWPGVGIRHFGNHRHDSFPRRKRSTLPPPSVVPALTVDVVATCTVCPADQTSWPRSPRLRQEMRLHEQVQLAPQLHVVRSFPSFAMAIHRAKHGTFRESLAFGRSAIGTSGRASPLSVSAMRCRAAVADAEGRLIGREPFAANRRAPVREEHVEDECGPPSRRDRDGSNRAATPLAARADRRPFPTRRSTATLRARPAGMRRVAEVDNRCATRFSLLRVVAECGARSPSSSNRRRIGKSFGARRLFAVTT